MMDGLDTLTPEMLVITMMAVMTVISGVHGGFDYTVL
jgi:hypothetical protein